MKMLIKQPSLCTGVQTASCYFCADRVAAEPLAPLADMSRIDHEGLRPGFIPHAASISLQPDNLEGAGTDLVEPLAPALRVYQPGLRIAMNSKHEINWEII